MTQNAMMVQDSEVVSKDVSYSDMTQIAWDPANGTCTPTCKPCAFYHLKQDKCRSEDSCEFCHTCPPGAVKWVKKQNRRKTLKLLNSSRRATLTELQARFNSGPRVPYAVSKTFLEMTDGDVKADCGRRVRSEPPRRLCEVPDEEEWTWLAHFQLPTDGAAGCKPTDGTPTSCGDSTQTDVISSAGTPTSCGDSTQTDVISSAGTPTNRGDSTETDMFTSLVFKNIPNDYDQPKFKEMLDVAGFKRRYDCLYLPADFQTEKSLAFGFVNCLTPYDAQRMMAFFDGFKGWQSGVDVPTKKPCRVFWNEIQEGSQGLVDKFRNTSVMHHTVPDKYKPVLFEHGFPKPFPGPTKKVQPPCIGKRGRK